jgi:peptide subunit release factor RF-3
MPLNSVLARDSEGNRVALFQDQWSLRAFGERNEEFVISDVALK